MSADPIIYCLENVTDYYQFERLCHDLMASEGFAEIEPLGGMKDKGRDAIHMSHSDSNEITIFAYSVREDWRKKLTEDADKIKKYGHQCNRLAFLCTSSFTPSERDEAVSYIKEKFGWTLELYGLERLRVLLSTKHEHIITKHPQIFVPTFFPVTGGVSLTFSPDIIVIDYSDVDEALATWISRRLSLEGYQVWCKSTAPVAGASLNDTIESLLHQRAFRFINILSPSAVSDPDMASRRAAALTIGEKRRCHFLIPVITCQFDEQLLDQKTRKIDKLRFDESWQLGLDKLLQLLETVNCPKIEGGERIAFRPFIHNDVLSNEPERLLSNRFPVLKVPEVIHRFTSKKKLDTDRKLRFDLGWSFRQVDPYNFLSFHQPPESISEQLKMEPAGGSSWPHVSEIDGISTRNLVPELIRKAVIVACRIKGLAFCNDLQLPYFLAGLAKSDRLYFKKPNGTRSFVNAVGKRTYWRPGSSSEYRYHLAPVFSVQQISRDSYVVITRVRLRLTDTDGKLLKGRTVNSRRKHLCKDWWNEDWLSRILSVMQFLGDGSDIAIGESKKDTITISTRPHEWTVPIGIDEEVLLNTTLSKDEALVHILDTYEDDDQQDEYDSES